MYAYKLRDTKASSRKFGPCECCGEHVTEVFMQTETFNGKHTDESHVFGHRDCLIARRQQNAVAA